MWNYSFEVPILMILAIIMSFYFSRPRLPIRRNLIFIHVIVIETVTIIIDLICVVVDNNYASHSVALVKTLNTLYFLAFFHRAYIFYLFAAGVMKDTIERNRIVKALVRIPLICCVIMSFISFIAGSSEYRNVIFYVDETGYHNGLLYNLVYVCGFFYVIMSFISVLLFKHRLGRRRERYGIFVSTVLIAVSLIVRLAWPKYLIMDTIILMAILIVFMAFGNPEYFIDLRGTAFNRAALSAHIEENKTGFKKMPFGIVVHNFVEMRDIYGLAQIEEGLALIATYLKQVFPGCIVFYCRTGRFVVIDNPDTDFINKIEVISERFTHAWKSETVELYLSVGFVTYEIVSGGYSGEVLLKTMLNALDKAGRGESSKPIHVTETDLQQTERENWVRQCIERVIDYTGFELFLQPILDATTGRVLGAEALSRIRDVEGNIIPPGIFIPIAENSGRINELGELVFEHTCKFIKESSFEKSGFDWINVNLSPAQFLRTDLAERYSAIVEKYGIDPAKVHLEITEQAMIDDSFLQRQLRDMGEKGFVFVLDDYGTGYSNLSRLKKCPFANVKLDMSIVWDFCKEQDAILPNMIKALKHMGFTITAEGIEDEDMERIMKRIGCDYLQGYHYSKPLPAKEFAERYFD